MSRDAVLEQEIQARGLNAPRVRPDDVQAAIASEHYFTADDGVRGSAAAFKSDGYEIVPEALGLLTFCVLVLHNGFTVHGVSAVASPENFNAEIGRKVARENAVDQIWPLLGYALRDKLHTRQTAVDNLSALLKQDVDRHPLHANVVADRSLD